MLIFCILCFPDSDAFAKPKKGKGKNNGNKNKQVVVVEKRIVERRYVPAPINNWTSVNSPIYSRYCPFSCSTEGINKNHCRDWREGNTCFVQDTSLNSYDYAIGKSINITESPGQVVGREIDRAITNVIR